MQSSQAETPNWSTADRYALAALGAFVGASLLYLVHPWYDSRNDAAMYIATARSFLAGEGISYLDAPFRIRPPGFVLLIAPFVGEGVPNFRVLNSIGSLFGAAGVLLLFVHQRPRTGWLVAGLTAAAIWLNPGYQRLATQVMSDVPGVALALLCLIVERWVRQSRSPGRDVALGALIAVSALIRSSIILIVPAIIVARLLERMTEGGEGWGAFALRRVGVLVLAVVVFSLPWQIAGQGGDSSEPADQTLIHSRSVGMWHTDRGDPGSPRLALSDILARPATHARAMIDVAGSRMRYDYVPGKRPAEHRAHLIHRCVSLVLLVGLIGAAWIRRSPMEIFAIGSLGVALFYFAFVDRLLLPVYVLALAASADALQWLLRRWIRPLVASSIVAVLIGGLIVTDLQLRGHWPEIRRQHEELLGLAAAAPAVLEPDARVGSMLGMHYSVFLDRPVFNFYFALQRAGGDSAAVEAMIDKYRLDTVLVWSKRAPDVQLAPYLEDRYGAPTKRGAVSSWRVRSPSPAPAAAQARTLPADIPAPPAAPTAPDPRE